MKMPEPEFLHAPERRLVAMSRDFTMETRAQIPELWGEFWSRGWDLPGEQGQACFGVSYSVQPDGRFSYAVGVHVEPLPEPTPEGACVVTLSAGRYAVFRSRGSVEELPELFSAIFGTWLPGSGETQREGAVFERYPYEENRGSDTITYEIWVPVAG